MRVGVIWKFSCLLHIDSFAMAHFPSIPSPKRTTRFEPKRKKKQAALLRPSDVRHVLRVVNAVFRWPERNCALVLTSLHAGLRCSEIARITPRDLLLPTGKFRSDVQLRAEITKGCKARIAYFTHPRLIAALDRYVQSRHAKRIGLSGKDEYAGLYPDAPFFFSSRSGGFAMVAKPRELVSGELGDYLAADGLEHLFRRIFHRAGLKACSSHSGRRTFASALLANGVSSEDISGLLGHADIDATGDYLECSEAMLEEAFADVL